MFSFLAANAVGFSKLIQATSNQPSTFSVEDTDVSTKNFTKYFDINFYGFANPPGIYIDMKLGIDRDVSKFDFHNPIASHTINFCIARLFSFFVFMY